MAKLKRCQQAISDADRINGMPSRDTKHVVVFGESGVGKSSLINLIAGEKVCETSSGALGCTLEYQRHLLVLDGQNFAIWDTAGLDEGMQNAIPADKAEAYLKQLLHELAKNDGVDLLVYCVRGTRVRASLLTNYHIFYSAICRKKVPITIAITGLENQEGSMEMWWYKNEPLFSQLKMYFDGHACVTTLGSSTENPLLKERRELSRKAVINMITSTRRTQQWRPPERSWVESAYSDIRAMLSPRNSGYGMHLATIIMCETTRHRPGGRLTRKRSVSFQNPVSLSPSLNSLSLRSPLSISNDSFRSKLPFEKAIKYTAERLYRVYQVSPKLVPSSKGTNEETKKVSVVKRASDLLIFCARMEEKGSGVVKFQWECFHSTYGGDLSPQIIVVVGAANQTQAEKWWEDAVGEAPTKNDLDIAYWPSGTTGTEMEVALKRLQYLINDRCIDCNKAMLMRDEKLFGKSLLPGMSSLTTLWTKLESNSGVEPPAEQDILTKVGVWYDIPERSPSITSPVSPVSLMQFPGQ